MEYKFDFTAMNVGEAVAIHKAVATNDISSLFKIVNKFIEVDINEEPYQAMNAIMAGLKRALDDKISPSGTVNLDENIWGEI